MDRVTVTCRPCCSGSTTAQLSYLSQYLYTGGEELAGRGEPSSNGINKTQNFIKESSGTLQRNVEMYV